MDHSIIINEPARAIIFDVETHAKRDPKVVETAYLYVNEHSLEAETDPCVQRFNPGVPITFGALATHHILPTELDGLPPSESFTLPSDVSYVIGHNVGFDLGAIGNPQGIKAIDTLALAQKAWPDTDSHTQSGLYYMIMTQRGESLEEARSLLKGAHGAGVDIQICLTIFQQLVVEYQEMIHGLPETLNSDSLSIFESMHLISEAARVPMTMSFGKHEGLAPWMVPEDYKRWYEGLEEPNQQLVLSMRQGGNTPEGQAVFLTAQQIFGEPSTQEVTPSPVASTLQRRFSF